MANEHATIEQEKDITRKLNGLSNSTQNLYEEICELQQRLIPVTSPPQEETEDQAKPSAECELSEKILDVTIALDNMSDHVRGILRRLQI